MSPRNTGLCNETNVYALHGTFIGQRSGLVPEPFFAHPIRGLEQARHLASLFCACEQDPVSVIIFDLSYNTWNYDTVDPS